MPRWYTAVMASSTEGQIHEWAADSCIVIQLWLQSKINLNRKSATTQIWREIVDFCPYFQGFFFFSFLFLLQILNKLTKCICKLVSLQNSIELVYWTYHEIKSSDFANLLMKLLNLHLLHKNTGFPHGKIRSQSRYTWTIYVWRPRLHLHLIPIFSQ